MKCDRINLAAEFSRKHWNALLCAWAVTLAVVLVGCTPAPLQETKTFQQAYVAADGAGQPLIDDLAVAERFQRQHIAVDSAKQVALGKSADPSRTGDCAKLRWKVVDRSTGFINGLCADDAPYYSKIGDPPETEVFREALALIGDLANALLALADGTSAAAATAQVQLVVQNISNFAGTVSAATGVGAAIGPAAIGLSAALSPLIKDVAVAASTEQERRVILDAGPNVSALIKKLHDAAPIMFRPLIAQMVQQIEHEDHPSASEVTRIEAYRGLLSDYMRLLDRLDDAWKQLVVAAKQPSNPASLSALAATSGQVAADAATVRQSLSALRLGAAAK